MRRRHSVGVKRYQPGALDRHGNPADAWLPAEPVEVYSVAPRFEKEPETGRTVVVEGLAVLAPASTAIGARDRVEVDGVEYEVEGNPADYTRGPFAFAGGIEILLKRTEG